MTRSMRGDSQADSPTDESAVQSQDVVSNERNDDIAETAGGSTAGMLSSIGLEFCLQVNPQLRKPK